MIFRGGGVGGGGGGGGGGGWVGGWGGWGGSPTLTQDLCSTGKNKKLDPKKLL